MAIRAIQEVLTADVDVAASASFDAGTPIARDLATGLGVPADRRIHGAAAYLGIAADATARVGNTDIQVDPVGSSYLDLLAGQKARGIVAANATTISTAHADVAAGANAGFKSFANAFFKTTVKRRLADFQAEHVNNVSNFTDAIGGVAGPRRGIGVFTTPSGQFVTDMYKLRITDTTTADVAFGTSGDVVPATNDLLTFGASNSSSDAGNAGYFVKLDPAATPPYSDGKACARVDYFDSTQGLLFITTL